MLYFNNANVKSLRTFDECFSPNDEGYLKVLTAVR